MNGFGCNTSCNMRRRTFLAIRKNFPNVKAAHTIIQQPSRAIVAFCRKFLRRQGNFSGKAGSSCRGHPILLYFLSFGSKAIPAQAKDLLTFFLRNRHVSSVLTKRRKPSAKTAKLRRLDLLQPFGMRWTHHSATSGGSQPTGRATTSTNNPSRHCRPAPTGLEAATSCQRRYRSY